MAVGFIFQEEQCARRTKSVRIRNVQPARVIGRAIVLLRSLRGEKIMSVFRRIINLVKKQEPPIEEKTPFTLSTGDIVDISFASYTVGGKMFFPQRQEAFLTLKDGSTIKYLRVAKREKQELSLYEAIDGRLEDINEIPSTIEMEGTLYHLEDQAISVAHSSGDTPFSSSDERYLWDFQSDDRKLLRIEWQAGQMMLYEGEAVLPMEVRIIQS